MSLFALEKMCFTLMQSESPGWTSGEQQVGWGPGAVAVTLGTGSGGQAQGGVHAQGSQRKSRPSL